MEEASPEDFHGNDSSEQGQLVNSGSGSGDRSVHCHSRHLRVDGWMDGNLDVVYAMSSCQQEVQILDDTVTEQMLKSRRLDGAQISQHEAASGQRE